MTVVLIAYDGTPNARRAVEHAGAYLIVRRAIILTIWSPMRTGAELARSVGLAAEPLCVPLKATVWRTIITTADNVDAGLIVTGTRGTTGLRSLMQSSVSDRVLRHGRKPMLIVPPGG